METFSGLRPCDEAPGVLMRDGTEEVEVLSKRSGEGFIFCNTLDAWIEQLQALRASIPPEYRGMARCDITADKDGCDRCECYPRIEILYRRAAR